LIVYYASRKTSTPWLVFFFIALLVGIFLRFYQLDTQMLVDDEWHAIEKLLHADARDIASHFGFSDYCIPLTLYYYFLYLHGGLSEWGMHFPVLLAGLALLIVAPCSTKNIAHLSTRVCWVALMAISPFLVYHSRTARPYALTNLFSFVAIMAFREWWLCSSARWRWGLVYIVSAFLSGYFHLMTLPFVLLPFVYYGVHSLCDIAVASRRTDGWIGLQRLTILGLCTALPLCAALLPPLIADWASLAMKAGKGWMTIDTLYRGLLLSFGIDNALLLGVCGVLLGIGIRSIWRRDRDLVGYLAVVVVGGALVVALSKAAWLQHPATYVRYIQTVIPFLLLGMAEGAMVLIRQLSSAAMQAGVAGVLLCGLYYAGPLPSYLYNPNQFMGGAYFQFDYDDAHNPYKATLPPGPISAFYRHLRQRPPRSLTLIETPWWLSSNFDAQPLYQAVHRQYVRMAFAAPVCGDYQYGNYPESDTGMQLQQFVHLSALLRGDTAGGDFLVVHLKSWPDPAHPPAQWPDMSICLPQIRQKLGAPAYTDDEVVVFALSDNARAALQ
jgi:hypothetical protein